MYSATYHAVWATRKWKEEGTTSAAEDEIDLRRRPAFGFFKSGCRFEIHGGLSNGITRKLYVGNAANVFHTTGP